MTPTEALLDFLSGERRPISRATLLTWIARHERINKEWPSLTVTQWENVLDQAINEMLVSDDGAVICLPKDEPVKRDSQGSLF